LCMPYSRASAFAAAVGCDACACLAAEQCLGCCSGRRGPAARADEGRGPPGAGILPAQGFRAAAEPALAVTAGTLTPAEGSLRAYAVWALPGHPELRGVHAGGALAWRGLTAYLPGGAYTYESGARLRGYATPGAAIDGFLREAGRHGSPALTIFRWQAAPARLQA
jgi:hypothetical protein